MSPAARAAHNSRRREARRRAAAARAADTLETASGVDVGVASAVVGQRVLDEHARVVAGGGWTSARGFPLSPAVAAKVDLAALSALYEADARFAVSGDLDDLADVGGVDPATRHAFELGYLTQQFRGAAAG